VFERFTNRARRVLVLAQEEARLLNHSFIGTEHILLGLIHEGEGLGAKAIESVGVSLEAVRERVEATVGPARYAPAGSPPFTPRAKKVLELSLREALQLGHNYIGTEHILLGLVREGDGVAAEVLGSLGVELETLRERILELLSGPAAPSTEGIGGGLLAPMGPPFERGSTRPEWSRYPTKVLSGPDTELSAEGIRLRIVALIVFDRECHVIWRMSGIPEPIVDLLNDAAGRSSYQPFIGSADVASRRRAVRSGDSRPFLSISDEIETPYRALQTSFDPQVDGEWAGRSIFEPAIEERARVLKIEWRNQAVTLDH
jgi:Clp amino terminal domain, pathogenicity island component